MAISLGRARLGGAGMRGGTSPEGARRRWLTGLAAPALAMGALAFMGVPAANAAVDAMGAESVAEAMSAQPGLVTGASFVTIPPVGGSAGVSTSSLGGFPTNGPTSGILSTGLVSSVPEVGTYASANLEGGNFRGDTDFDVTVLKVDLDVEQGNNCLSFDFKFLSEEYPNFVGSKYNDGFIAELDESTWTTYDTVISAPNNFAFDAEGDVVSVNSTGIGGMSPGAGAGTAFDGKDEKGHGAATQQLSAATTVTSGAHSLYLSIFDQGDRIYDSAVFLDNLRSFQVADGADCVPGAKPVTPAAPVAPAVTQTSCTDGMSVAPTVTLAESEGIEYTLVGAVAAGETVIVTAVPESGYSLVESDGWQMNADGTATYTVDLEAATCPAEVTPVAPEVVQAACVKGQATDPKLTLPDTQGITYTVAGDVVAGSVVEVFAAAKEGYIFPAEVEGWVVAADRVGATLEVVLESIDCKPILTHPQDPKIVEATCDAGPSVKLAKTEGVTYSGLPKELAAGQSFTLTAVAEPGYELGEAVGWAVPEDGVGLSKTFQLADAPSDCDSPVDGSDGGDLAKTGASVSLALILGIGAVGSGLYLLRRYAKA